MGDTTKNAAIREQDLTSVRFIYSYTPSCHSSGVNKSKWERALVPGTLNHRALDRVRFNLRSHLNYILLSLWHFLFSCSCIKVNPDRYFDLLYFDCFKKFCRLEWLRTAQENLTEMKCQSLASSTKWSEAANFSLSQVTSSRKICRWTGIVLSDRHTLQKKLFD